MILSSTSTQFLIAAVLCVSIVFATTTVSDDSLLNSNETESTNKTKRCVVCSTSTNTYHTHDRYIHRYNDGTVVQKLTYHPGFEPHTHSRIAYDAHESPCANAPCGTNAMCRETGGRPVCSCPSGYSGNPLTHCTRAECFDNVECRGDLACNNGRCVNPCAGACGAGANCETINHVAVCSCPKGYKGDPFHACRLADPEEQCHPSPCGVNSKCEIINSVATCSCLPGYIGNPLSGCRHECDNDHECGSQEMCKDFKCVAACHQCGTGAQCGNVVNHRAECTCPKGYIGSPYTECRPECYGDSDCPAGRPACFYGICKNTCEGACGIGADCNLRGLTPVCSCPKDMTGDPFIRCRPFTKQDLCEPNPCGTNAICIPGHDNTGKERPVCNCQAGYTGNALTHCSRGECQSNEGCADNKACINYQCVNPCIGKCAPNAICEAKGHLAVCKCPEGTTGDALIHCRESRTYPVARYHSIGGSSCTRCV